MNGWKTYVAGAGAIATGLGIILAGVVAGFNGPQIVEGAIVLLGGLAALGLGHKAEKIKAVLENATADTVGTQEVG